MQGAGYPLPSSEPNILCYGSPKPPTSCPWGAGGTARAWTVEEHLLHGAQDHEALLDAGLLLEALGGGQEE
jgi:hypothetical protein